MATTAEQVRLYTALTATELTDADIVTWLDINDDDPRAAAADALEAYASTLATIQVTSDDISLDGSKRAKTLMDRAARLREQAADGGFFFDVIDLPAGHAELAEWEIT